MINTGEQNKPSGGGRSILDYSLVACFTLVVLLLILMLDAFEYIKVPGSSHGKGNTLAADNSDTGAVTSDELAEVQKQIEAAKAELAAKKAEVTKLVTKVETEINDKSSTPAEKAAEEKKEEEVIEAVVEKEVGLDMWCGNCQYKMMAFNCDQRVNWMMSSYSITRDQAKKSVLNGCHYRRVLRGGVNGN